MKANRIFKTSDNSLNWQEIMKEASNYKYVVMYRDHYQGNGKGEFFAADRLAALMEEQPYWFSNNEDRSVYEVILTDEDIPKIIADRRKVIDQIQTAECTKSNLSRPVLKADRRSTRRTQPEAWAEYDKAVEAYNADRSALELSIAGLRAALKVIPYYSTTLLQIR